MKFNRSALRTGALLGALLLGLFVALALPTVALADPHHVNIYANAACQEGYSFGANYVGGSGWRRAVVDVDANVDGVAEAIGFTWEGVSPGFNLFDRSGAATQNVDVTGTVTLYDRTFHNGTSSDTDGPDTFSSDHSSNSSMNADIDFHNSNRDVEIDADSGYIITFVGIDYTGSDANEVTFAPNAASFDYDAPSTNDIEHVTVTIFRAGTPDFYTYNQVDLDIFNFHKTLDCYQPCDEQTDWVLVDTSEWTFNPDTGLMERTLSYEKHDVRDQSLCDSKQEVETRDPEQRYFADPDCEGWAIYKTGEGIEGDELVDAGVWENPLADESFTHEEYDLYIAEPQDCFEIGEDISFEADCDAWAVYALTLVDGEVKASELIDSGEWRNPYKQESVVVVVDEQEIKFFEPAECVQCKKTAVGEMFTLIGPDGQVGYLASYQRNPNTDDWAIPNAGAQQACLGFVAVAAPHGETIYRDCNGEITLVCYRCMGGADGIDGAYFGED